MILLFSPLAKHRVVKTNDSIVIKKYDIRSTSPNHMWTGMNEFESFLHEAQVLQHIEREKSRCKHTNEVGRLIDINFHAHTITTEKLGTKFRPFRGYRDFCRLKIQRIHKFFECIGVVHCDTKTRNLGVIKNSTELYIFDMELAYLAVKGRPPKMACNCNLSNPCFF